MFKDLVASDIKSVFLNADEFANTLLYNGVEISVVQDKEQLMKKQMDGQVEGNNLIYAAVSDFETAPNIGDAVKLNSKKAMITDVSDVDGMYEIVLMESRR